MLAVLNMEVVHTSSVFIKFLCIVFVIPGFQAVSNATLDYTTTDKSLIGTQNTNFMLDNNQAETHYYTIADSNLDTNTSSEENVTPTTTITEGPTTGATYATTNSSAPSPTTLTASYTTTNSPSTIANGNTLPPTTTSPPCEYISIANITTESVWPTEVNLLLNLEAGQNCHQDQAFLNITCTPKDTWAWVTGLRNYASNPLNFTYHLKLDNLSEFTHYTCDFEVVPGHNTSVYSFRTAEDVPSEPRNLSATNITSSSFSLTWDIPIKVPAIFVEYVIIIERRNVSSENHYWTGCLDEPEGNYTFRTNSSYLHFDNALADSNYFVQVQSSSHVGLGKSTNITLSTLVAVPSEPRNLRATNITSSSFSLTWDIPIKIPTILVEYVIIIERRNVSSENHFWTGCLDEPKGNYTFRTNSSYLHFDNALADFNYFVQVQSSSHVGMGNSTNITLSTLVAASEPPHNVTSTVIEVPVGDKNIENRLNLSWDMPCNTNGPVNEFSIELFGYYSFNESRNHNKNFSVPVHSNFSSYFHAETNLMAAANYSLQISANSTGSLKGISYNTTFTTWENFPSAPRQVNATIQAHNFTLHWNEPTNNPGNITRYRVDITFLGLEWERTNSCTVQNKEYNETIYQLGREFTATKLIPGSTYSVAISGETSKGVGNSTKMTITTTMYYPEILEVRYTIDDRAIDGSQYNASALIEFIPGCFNGEFDHYYIAIMGSRGNYEEYLDERMNHSNNNSIQQFTFSLKPDYYYSVNVSVKNVNLSSTTSASFTSPSGVPIVNDSIIRSIEPVAGQTEATITLKKDYFIDSQGDIRYISIIVSSENVSSGEYHRWDNNAQWPEPDVDVDIYYQATEPYWNPFVDADSVDFVIGNDTSCDAGTQFCNRPLQPGKTYFVFVRMFTGNYYRNSSPIILVTNPVSRLGFILGLIFGLLGAATVGFIGLILWRKGFVKKIVSPEEPIQKTETSKEKFVEYCQYLEHNPDVLNKQWQDLEIKSAETYEGLQHHFALLPENRRKNRFTNILPFDHTRVKLNIDEDDDISSDYINASYIKGFSTQNQYIATQGPLPHTVRDFWKMIFQENVSIIIMVARFIENKREKCYKYFPNNHETMLFGDDLEVRCSIELHFQIYCIRTLQVRRDDRQLTVTHVQFLEWPDFGVPEGTDNLLLFYRQIRDRWAAEGGMAVVHCSAGVGRTGTIIATDILIRAMESGKKIDVFNTVLELRRQRKSMVQTEKQYMYIHQLLRSVIEDPLTEDDDSHEHVYQNVDLNTKFGNGLVESAF